RAAFRKTERLLGINKAYDIHEPIRREPRAKHPRAFLAVGARRSISEDGYRRLRAGNCFLGFIVRLALPILKLLPFRRLHSLDTLRHATFALAQKMCKHPSASHLGTAASF